MWSLKISAYLVEANLDISVGMGHHQWRVGYITLNYLCFLSNGWFFYDKVLECRNINFLLSL